MLVSTTLLVLALSTTPASSSSPLTFPAIEKSKFVGFWRLAQDEDGSPTDTMEFRSDGTYVSHGSGCKIHAEFPYHSYKGNLYVTLEWPKGPVAIVFKPNEAGQLVFTSPRTGNNAYYERVSDNPCPSKP